MNKNVKRIFLFTTLVLLLVAIGAVSASDTNDTQASCVEFTQSQQSDTVDDYTQAASVSDNKEIKKVENENIENEESIAITQDTTNDNSLYSELEGLNTSNSKNIKTAEDVNLNIVKSYGDIIINLQGEQEQVPVPIELTEDAYVYIFENNKIVIQLSVDGGLPVRSILLNSSESLENLYILSERLMDKFNGDFSDYPYDFHNLTINITSKDFEPIILNSKLIFIDGEQSNFTMYVYNNSSGALVEGPIDCYDEDIPIWISLNDTEGNSYSEIPSTIFIDGIEYGVYNFLDKYDESNVLLSQLLIKNIKNDFGLGMHNIYFKLNDGEGLILNPYLLINLIDDSLLRTSITLNDIEINKYDDIIFDATIFAADDKTDNMGVEFSINGEFKGKVAIEGNRARFKTPSDTFSPGTYTIKAVLIPDEYHAKSSDTATLTVNKFDTRVYMYDVSGYKMDNVEFIAEVSSSYDGTDGVVVKFYVDNNEVGQATVTGGVATCEYTIPSTSNIGSHNLKAVVVADDTFETSEGTASLTVNKLDTSVSLSDVSGYKTNPVELTATVSSTHGSTDGATIKFYVDNSEVGEATVTGGVATCEYTIPSTTNIGTYSNYLKAVVVADDTFETSEGTASLTVSKKKLEITLDTYKANKGDIITITPTFNDTVTDGKLDIAVDDSNIGTINYQTDSGSIDYDTSRLSAGNHKITLTYHSSTIYEGVNTQTGMIKVTEKAKVSLTSPQNALETYAKSNVQTTLVFNNTLTDGMICVYVDENTTPICIKSGLNSNSFDALISTNKLNAGSHTLHINYTGSSRYNDYSKDLSLTVHKIDTNIVTADKSGNKNSNIYLTATVSSDNGDVNSVTVNFYIDDKYVGQSAVSESTASLNYQIPSTLTGGSHTIKAVVVSDDYYETSEDTAVLTVNKKTPTISVIDLLSSYSKGETITLKASVIAGGNEDGTIVKFYVNDEEVGSSTVNQQIASCSYTIPLSLTASQCTVKAVVVADDSYNTAEATQTFDISKANIKITINGLYKSDCGKNVTITPTFNSTVNDGMIYLSVDDNIVAEYDMSVVSTIKFNTTGLSSGFHPIKLIYNSSTVYNDAESDKANLYINPKALIILDEPTDSLTSTYAQPTQIAMIFNNTLSDGKIEVYVDNEETPRYTNNNPSGNSFDIEVDTSDLNAGTHTLTFKYGASDIYEDYSSDISLIINKAKVTITPENQVVNVNKNDAAVITVSINPTITGNIIFKENDEVIDTVPIAADGTSVLNYNTANADIGQHLITVELEENDNYEAQLETITLNVNKRLLGLSFVSLEAVQYLESTDITVRLNDTVNEGKLELRIDNQYYGDTRELNTEYIEFSNLDTTGLTPGNHEIKLIYTFGTLFDNVEVTDTLVITKIPVEISIVNTQAYTTGPYVQISFNDSVEDGSISLYINGNEEAYCTQDIYDGNNVNININPADITSDTLNVVVKYTNSQYYSDATASGVISIIKPQINFNELDIDSIDAGKDGYMTAYLSEEIDIEDVTWTVLINNQEATIKNIYYGGDNDYGITFDVSNAHVGDNDLVLKLTNSQKYADSEAEGVLTINLKENSITLIDSPSCYINEEEVSFEIQFDEQPNDGVLDIFIGSSTTPVLSITDFVTGYDSAGNRMTIPLDVSGYTAGSYNLQLKYHDSSIYNNITEKTTLKINKRNLYLYLASFTTIKGEKHDFNIGFNGSVSDGKLELYIGSSTTPVATTTQINGNEVVFADIDTGDYDIGTNNYKVKYSGSQVYNDVERTQQFLLNKRDIHYTVDAASVAKGDKTNITVTFNDTVSDGSLKVYVNDATSPSKTFTQIDGKTVVITDIDTSTFNIGDNKINVTFTGSALYENNDAISTLTLTKRTLDMTVDAPDIAKGDLATITITLNDTVNDGTLNVYIDDESTPVRTINNPNSEIVINDISTVDYALGNRNIIVKYTASELFDDKTKTTTLNIIKRDLSINTVTSTVAKGDKTKVTLTLNDTLTDGKLEVFIGDSLMPVETVTSFDSTTITLNDIDTSSYSIGDNTVTVKYSDSELFNDAESTGTLTLTTRNLAIAVDASSVAKCDETTVTITLNDTVNDGKLEVFIGDSDVAIDTITSFDSNTITIEDIDTSSYNIGDNTITVKYSEGSLFADNEVTGTLTLTTRDIGITVGADTVAKGDDATILITLNDTVADGKLEVFVGDSDTPIETVTSFDDSTITLTGVDTSNYNIGDNIITVKYSEGSLYAPKEVTGTLTLTSRDLSITVSADTVSKGDKTRLTITLNDTVTDGKLEVFVGDSDTPIETVTSFDDMTITLTDVDTANYNIGDNTITVKYSEGSLFADTEVTGTLTLTNRDLSITVEATTVAKGDTTTVTIILNDTVADGKLEVFIGDSLTPVQTITSFDSTTLTIDDVDTSAYNIGDNTITVKYSDSALFNNKEASGTLTLTTRDLGIAVSADTVAKGDTTTITLTLNDTVTDGKLDVFIGDSLTPVETVNDIDSTTITLSNIDTSAYNIGDNVITVKYSDSSLFADKDITGTLTLTSRDIGIAVSADTVAKGDTTTVTITLNDTVTDGKLEVFIGENPVETITSFDSTTITLSNIDTSAYNIGENTITVKYSEGSLFADKEATGTLTLTSRDLNINVEANTVAKGDTTTITVTLNDTVADGKIDVFIGDSEDPIETIASFDSNTITLNNVDTTGYNIGDNTITVKYSDSDLYADKEATGTLTLTSRDLGIAVGADTVAKGDTTTVTIILNDTVTDGKLDVFIGDSLTSVETVNDIDSTTITLNNIDTSSYDIGDNIITVKYSEGSLYAPKEATGTLTLTARDLAIAVTADTVAKGDASTIRITLNDTVADGKLDVFIGDSEVPIETITNIDSTAITIENVETANYNIGENTITVKFSGSDLYVDKEATGTLTLTNRIVSMDVETLSVAKGDKTTITITLNDTVTDGKLEVFIGDNSEAIESITSFDSTTITLNDIDTSNYNIGENAVSVKYTDSQLFNDAEATGTLTLTNRDLTITITAPSVAKDDIATITIELNDTVTDGILELYINDETTPIRTINPVTTSTITFDDIDTSSYPIGDNNIIVKYGDSHLYNDKTSTEILTLTDRDLGITVQSNSVAKNDKTQITIKLNETVNDGILEVFIGEDENPLKTINEFDGKEITINNIDTSGYAIGDNQITVKYSNGQLFADKTVTSTLTLTSRLLDITTEALNVAKGDKTNIILMLNDTPTDGLLEVFINDEQTPIYTSSQFSSKLIVINNIDTSRYPIGDNDVHVKYSNSQLFADATSEATLTLTNRQVEFTVTAQSVAKADKTQIIIGLNDSLSDGTLNVYINDEEVPIKTITDFDTKVIVIDDVDTANYNVGDNPIILKYAGSNLYSDTTANGVLTLTARDLNIAAEDVSLAKGDLATITITLNDTVSDGKLDVFIGDNPVAIESITSFESTVITITDVDTSTYNIGENTITVKYTDSNLFNNADATATLTLTSRDLSIDVEAMAVSKGDKTTITVTLNDTVTDGKLEVFIGDNQEPVKTITDIDSRTITITDVETGDYNIGENTVTVKYSEGSLFNNVETTAILTLTSRDLAIDVDAISVAKGDKTNITITLNDTVTDGKLEVFIGESEVAIETITNFEDTTITLTDVDTSTYPVGENTITVKYSEGSLYAGNEATGTLTLTNRDLSINVQASTVAKGDSATITITLNDTVSDGKLEVFIADSEVAIETITNFEDTTITLTNVDTSNYAIGENTVTVKYSNSNSFAISTGTGSLIITNRDLNIEVGDITTAKGDITEITITLNDTVNDGTITVYINNQEVPIRTVNEITTSTIIISDVQTADYNIGDNNIIVKYSDSTLFNDKEVTATLTLTTRDLGISVEADTVSKRDFTTITITLNDTVADGKLDVFIGDSQVPIETITTIDSTVITINNVDTAAYNIGDNTITVKYSDSSLYAGSEVTGTLTLTSRDLGIDVEDSTVAKGDSTTITVTLNDTVTDGKLEVFIGDSNTPIETITNFDSNVITLTDVDTSSYDIGENTITVKYSDSDLYADKEATGTLTLTSRDLGISVEASTVAKGDTTTVTVTLNDTVSDGKLEVFVGDSEVPVRTVTDIDSMTITLTDIATDDYSIGDNTITVKYSEGNLFADKEVTGTLTLTSRDLSISVEASTVAKGDKTTITITLNDTVTDGELKVYINDVEVPIETITDFDSTTITIENVDTSNYNIGDNTITVKYSEGSLFADKEVTGTLTLTTRDLGIVVDAITVSKGDSTTITVTLNDTVNDGKLDVFVGDSDDPIETIASFDSNTITLNNVDTTGYNIGENTITVKYSDGSLFADKEATGTLTLISRDLGISVDALSVAKGDTTTVTITLNDTVTDGKLEVFIAENLIETVTGFDSTTIVLNNIDTSAYEIGDNSITVKYSEGSLFADNEATGTLTLTSRDLGISVEATAVSKGDSTTVTITLNDTVTDGKLEVFIGDSTTPIETVTSFDSNIITLDNVDTTNYNIGDNTITVKYSESDPYADNEATGTLTLTSRDLGISVEASTVAKGDSTTITVTFNDTVADGKLEVFVGDSEVPVRTVTDIDTTITLTDIDTAGYSVGDNIVTVKYSESVLFDDKVENGILTLTNRTLLMDVETESVAKGDTTTIKITLNDTLYDGQLNVYIGLDETPVRTITDFDSNIIIIDDIDTSNYDIGDNNVLIKYTDSQFYNDTQKTGTLTLALRDLEITADNQIAIKQEKTSLTITLNDTITDGILEVFIADMTTPLKTITEFNSKTITLTDIDTSVYDVGENNILVKYKDSQLFKEAETTATLTITARDLDINVNTVSVPKGDKTNIIIVLNQTPEDGKLEVFIKDTSVPVKTIDEFTNKVIILNNVETSEYDIGDNEVIVKYTDSQVYADKTVNSILTLTPRQLDIAIDSLSVPKGDDTITTLLLNESITDGVIEVFINDESEPVRVINEFNSKLITLKDIPTGDYNVGDNNIIVKYSQSMLYDDNSYEAILTLTTRQLAMTVKADTVAKKDLTQLTVTLNDTIADGKLEVFIGSSNTPVRTITEFDSKTITLTDITTDEYDIGDNQITVKYSDSNLYDDSTAEGILTLIKRDLSIDVSSTLQAKGDKTTITLVLNDTVFDGILNVFINDKIVPVKTITSFDDTTIIIPEIDTANYNIGDNQIIVTYGDSDLFNDIESTGTLTLINRDLSMTVESVTVAKEDLTEITIKLNDTINDGVLEVFINDATEAIATITEFDSTDIIISDVETKDYNIGDNIITVKYSGSLLFNDAKEFGVLTLTNRTLDIKAEASEEFKLDKTTITLTLNETPTDGIIEVFINDNTQAVRTITEFDTTIVLTDIDTDDYNIGDNTVIVKYSGSNLYSDSQTQAVLTLNKRDVNIIIDSLTVPKANSTIITLTLNDTLTDGVLEVFINDDSNAIYTTTEFNQTITIEDVDTSAYNIGENTITVKYIQSQLFNDITTEGVLTLTARNLQIDVDSLTVSKADKTSITLTLNDTLSDGVLEVFINDIDTPIAIITSFDSNIITINDIDTSSYNIGENNIIIKYTQSNTYADLTQTNTLTLTDRLLKITANTLNISKDIKQTTLTVTFNDTVNDGVIKVYSNNKQIASHTIKENCTTADIKIYNLNMPLGESNITVNYTDSRLYSNTSTTTQLTNSKVLTAITVDPVVLNANRTANITARVDAIGSDTTVNEGKVIFKINGKTLKDANGKVIYVKVVNGTARLEYSFGKLSSYDNLQITASYAGTTVFNASKSDTVTVQKPADKATAILTVNNITTTKNSKVTFTATVKDLDGNNVCYGKVLFKFNGRTLADSNGKAIILDIVDGVVSLDYEIPDLKSNNYIIFAVMGADDFYHSTRANATLTVEE